ncbi:MAG: hypothetical protein AB7T59_06795 [Hyphomonadaceae bacterium]
MLLRRFLEHLRKQPWTAIGIEFLIVVIGVFVASQVTEWSAAQADRRLGREYTARLVSDLEQDLENRRLLVAYYDAVYASAERAAVLLQEPNPNPKALLVNAYRASEYAFYPPTRATWDTIVSAGDLRLLPQAAVHNGLADYFSYDAARDVLEDMRRTSYRQRVRSLIPHLVQEAIRERCGDTRNDAQEITGFREDCDLDVDDAALRSAAQRLLRDRALSDDLAYQFSTVIAARANLAGDVAFLEGAIAGLREPAGE